MPLDESFGHWIARLYRSSQNHLASRMAKLQIGRGQHSFLLVLFSKDGISQDYLAQTLHINKAAVARALLKLEQNGYIEKRKEDTDRRNNHIYLTKKAIDVKEQFLSEIDSWTEKLADGLSRVDQRQLIKLLKHMGDNADLAIKKYRLV
jgi:DNA-binding MarR family transcriptional regulator